MLVSILLPTHNRPALMREALASIAAQTSSSWEVIVVDDGSADRVSAEVIRSIVGERFALFRNESPRGIAAAKNRGLEAARGEVLTHLDDDDLLEPHAVEAIIAAYDRRPDIDCLFINVRAFGQYAAYANESQRTAMANLLALAGGEADRGLTVFDKNLVLALLRTVPWPFQRPAARRSAWQRIGSLPVDVSLPEPEWALYAALICRTALLNDPVYLVRAEGQGYASRPSNSVSHLDSGIRTKERFAHYLNQGDADSELRTAAKDAYAASLASKAYYCTREERSPALALKASIKSFGVKRSMLALKLIARSL